MATEGVARLLVHHFVDRHAWRRRRARKAASKLPGDIEVSASMPHQAFGRRRRRGSPRCSPSDGQSATTSSGARGACSRASMLEPLVLQRLLDGAQAVRPLGMAGGRQVIEAGGMGDEEGGHGRCRQSRYRSVTAKPYPKRSHPRGMDGLLVRLGRAPRPLRLGLTRRWRDVVRHEEIDLQAAGSDRRGIGRSR